MRSRRPEGVRIQDVLYGTLIVSALALFVVTFVLGVALWRTDGNLEVDQQRLFLDAYIAIGIGSLVAVLGAVVPHLLPEARDRFVRLQDSRIAYSQAKTSVIYLAQTVATLPFGDAVALIRHAHEKLHLAETYADELPAYLHWHPHPGTWLDRNYWEIEAIRTACSNVERWSGLAPDQRLKLINEITQLVEQAFGPDNRNWAVLYDERGKLRPDKKLEKLEEERKIEHAIALASERL